MQAFVAAFSEELLDMVEKFPDDIEKRLAGFAQKTEPVISLQTLFKVLKSWCGKASRKIVLMIDEVDTASNDQVFVDFLAQLRACYLKRRRIPVFQSVILAGVYDVRSMKRKIRSDGEDIRILFRVCVNIWMKRSQEVRNFRIRAAYGQEKVFMRPKE